MSAEAAAQRLEEAVMDFETAFADLVGKGRKRQTALDFFLIPFLPFLAITPPMPGRLLKLAEGYG